MRRSTTHASLCFLAGTALLVACTVRQISDSVPARDDNATAATATGSTGPAGPLVPDLVNEDSGVFGASEHPASSGFVTHRDAGTTSPSSSFCADGVGAGDLAVVELMIASRSGSGDDAEWVEVQSTRDCWLHLEGVQVTSPRGQATPNTAVLPALDLAPGATFLVADTADATANHALPGIVFPWNATDVLKNDGDSVVVSSGTVEVDRVTYPTFRGLPVGRSLSFPADCAWTDRADWARWSLTFHAFSPGFMGTPNAPNTDVSCF